MSDCVFCDITKKLAPAKNLRYHGSDVWSFRPLDPVTRGHLLFVHEMHTDSAGEKPYIAGVVFDKAAGYAHGQDRDYNLITSCGEAATQTIEHFHVHLVPRLGGDQLKLPWTGQAKP
jgi:histidine triad (HIT) family protein